MKDPREPIVRASGNNPDGSNLEISYDNGETWVPCGDVVPVVDSPRIESGFYRVLRTADRLEFERVPGWRAPLFEIDPQQRKGEQQ